MAKLKDLPPPEKYEHGTRARYVTGCKCKDCKKANSLAYHDRERRSKEAALARKRLPPVEVYKTWKAPDGKTKRRRSNNGCPGVHREPCPKESILRKDSVGGICGTCRLRLIWNGLVPTTKVRNHLRKLSANGVGRRAVVKASGVGDTAIAEIVSGEKRKVRAQTEQAILNVLVSDAFDGAYIPARESWILLRKMMGMGMTKTEIARRLGSESKAPSLQVGKEKVKAVTAADIKELWEEVKAEQGISVPSSHIDICTDCGYSHKPANRQRLIKRMVLEGFEARPIKDRWPCFYPHVKVNDASDRRLHRDINAVKDQQKEKK